MRAAAGAAVAVVERDQRGDQIDDLKRLLVEVAEGNRALAIAQARTTAMLDAVEARLAAMLNTVETGPR